MTEVEHAPVWQAVRALVVDLLPIEPYCREHHRVATARRDSREAAARVHVDDVAWSPACARIGVGWRRARLRDNFRGAAVDGDLLDHAPIHKSDEAAVRRPERAARVL